jgi:hypothetical protein
LNDEEKDLFMSLIQAIINKLADKATKRYAQELILRTVQTTEEAQIAICLLAKSKLEIARKTRNEIIINVILNNESLRNINAIFKAFMIISEHRLNKKERLAFLGILAMEIDALTDDYQWLRAKLSAINAENAGFLLEYLEQMNESDKWVNNWFRTAQVYGYIPPAN